ncbi:hypothetical protein KUTeg_007739 [Tegillarca granosa]|uniref:Androglobin n=1 Tax=Tegillarca granosa TaxID=220873 RepID=A0ABQ9FE67_TEGGR|nr:hypothetical protein KUTeg_007739 [Tegillarca granosa]
MASKAAKKGPSANRVNSATPREAASIAASAGGPDSKRPKLAIWPEWNDADVNAEKWDAVHKGKEKVDKGKSPVAVQAYDDIEGKIDMPPSLRVVQWKRPSDFITEKTPVVVDPDHGMNGFDLINCNEHLHDSELMRFIISQITALWEMSAIKNPPPDQADASVPYEEYTYSWRPWEHIYTINKVQKGPHIPPYNPYGKYAVRLYWMGCWRKIIVDDQMPFDDNDQLLLPATSHQHELWPMLLTKGLIKIASLEYSGGSASSEFGDCNIIQCLTGWIPESIPLQYGHINEVWELLKSSLPEWKLPLQEWEKQQDQLEEKKDEGTPSEIAKEDKSEKDSAKDAKGEKADVKSGKDTGKDKAAKDGKDKDKGGKDKDKKDKGDKDKDKKDKEKSTLDETPLPENPEVVVFATYCSTPKYPVKVSVLGEMADASERLRQNGLSHIYPHPVWITQTRSCPLEPPPPPEIVPAWKLIRPKKKKTLPTDEPMAEAEPPKPIQCIEITSPFVNYKVSPVPIPTETHRPRSSLERGGTRSRPATGNVGSIEETDENAPEPEPVPQKVEPVEPPPDETQVEEPPIEAVSPVLKPSTPGEKKKKGSGKSREGKESKDTKDNREASPKTTQRKMSTSDKSKTERGKSAEKVASASKTKEEEKEKAKVPPPPSTPTQQLDSGLAPPPPPEGQTPEDGEEAEIEGEIAIEEPVEQDDSAKPKKVWMDFMEFCKCFKTLYIYHKPNTYPCNHKYSDPKKMERLYNTQLITQSAVPAGKADKKSAPATAGVNTSSSKTAQTPTHMHSAPSPTNPHSPTGYDDRSPHYLFVDNLKPTEIVVCFVSLSRWHEPPPITIDEKKSHTSIKGKGDKNEPEKELTNVTSSSVLDGSIGGEKPTPVVVQPGTLVAEPYSWKSLVTGQPILRLRTTATKAAVLSLPAGRHVLRFMMSGPLGHHVHLCSSVQFVFGDEETVMQHLTKESCRFVDNATQVMNSIGKCINAFNDTEGFKQAWDELVSYHCPYRNDKLMSKQHHFQVFNEALYNTLTKSLKDIINLETVYAWRVFNYDTTTKNILGLSSGSRPATGTTSQRGSAKQPPAKGDKDKDKNKREAEKVENPWANREPTNEELVSAVKLQKSWRGYWVRKIKAARTPGTEENLKVMEILQKCWTILEANAESNGLFLLGICSDWIQN